MSMSFWAGSYLTSGSFRLGHTVTVRRVSHTAAQHSDVVRTYIVKEIILGHTRGRFSNHLPRVVRVFLGRTAKELHLHHLPLRTLPVYHGSLKRLASGFSYRPNLYFYDLFKLESVYWTQSHFRQSCLVRAHGTNYSVPRPSLRSNLLRIESGPMAGSSIVSAGLLPLSEKLKICVAYSLPISRVLPKLSPPAVCWPLQVLSKWTNAILLSAIWLS